MKIKLLKISPPFNMRHGYFVGNRNSDTYGEGLFITFWGVVDETSEIKQFYCRVNAEEQKVPSYFSTLMFANIGDELDILPWRYPGSDGNACNLGSCVIGVKNLSHPERNVSADMLSYEDRYL